MNHADLLVDGHRVLPALLRDVAAARRSIHLSMFLFFRDPIGEEIAASLARKAVAVSERFEIKGSGRPEWYQRQRECRATISQERSRAA